MQQSQTPSPPSKNFIFFISTASTSSSSHSLSPTHHHPPTPPSSLLATLLTFTAPTVTNSQTRSIEVQILALGVTNSRWLLLLCIQATNCFRGTTLVGLISEVDRALVMSGDGMSHNDFQYDIAEDERTVVKHDFSKTGWGKSFRWYVDELRHHIKALGGHGWEKPQALLGGFDGNKEPRVPLLYMVSEEFVSVVHESREKFVCIGGGHDSSRVVLIPHFNASTCSWQDAVRLAQGSVARAGDDGNADGIIKTVAVTAEDGVVHRTNTDISVVRKEHGFGLMRRPLI
ncbi:hypothetical protein C5167_042684 [Papaver somniferum]|uniref:Uncharacterized protein n=1 Tax=Papaver somniferum TaxID=3469 RepID=A0A4Y7L587_PAPSO|nr:hypothetical protein C5167_042684 [Papaver somniferum]